MGRRDRPPAARAASTVTQPSADDTKRLPNRPAVPGTGRDRADQPSTGGRQPFTDRSAFVTPDRDRPPQPATGGRQPFPGWTPAFRAALEQLALAKRQPARGLHTGDARSRVRGRALEFADHRPYAPGDDPKLVDWRAYARLERLYLKQFEVERARTLSLLIDVSASLDWGDGEAHKGAYARRMAAALAWIGLSRGDVVKVWLLRDGRAESLAEVASRGGAGALFRRLGEVIESGPTDLAAAVRATHPEHARGPVVLASDLLDPSWPAAIDSLAASREGAVVQLLAPDEWEPPLGDEVELEDAETGEVRATRSGPSELASYQARLANFVASVQTHCHNRGIVYVGVDTGTPLQRLILRDLPAAGVLT